MDLLSELFLHSCTIALGTSSKILLKALESILAHIFTYVILGLWNVNLLKNMVYVVFLPHHHVWETVLNKFFKIFIEFQWI